jgi:hypothetical protein
MDLKYINIFQYKALENLPNHLATLLADGAKESPSAVFFDISKVGIEMWCRNFRFIFFASFHRFGHLVCGNKRD